MHIAQLTAFTILCSTAITLLLYSILINPWVCSFLLAAITVLFTLENCALLTEVQRKDEEIEVLKSTHNQGLMQKVKCLEVELENLTKERDSQRHSIHKLRLMCRHTKSGSF